MPDAERMAHRSPEGGRWSGRRIGITGARGALGGALCRVLRQRGAEVIGLTHSPPPSLTDNGPNQWIVWQCGHEEQLEATLTELDILVINHGINPQGDLDPDTVDRALEINALSSWRLLRLFESITTDRGAEQPSEVWVNTSEAEIQPALSPVYELSKRLIGQLISLRGTQRGAVERERLRIRKLVLGPFRSDLNPIGLMTAGFVAQQVIFQASLGLNLIIVSPNPLTYLLMPMHELARRLYSAMLSRRDR